MAKFAKSETFVFDLTTILWANFDKIEYLIVTIKLYDGKEITVYGIDAIEVAMLIKPSVLESKRLRWVRFDWMIHNIIGHPVMQLMALFGFYRAAFWVHDKTVPRPLGKK